MKYLWVLFVFFITACQPPQAQNEFATRATLDNLRSEPAVSPLPAVARHRKKSIERIPAKLKQPASISIGENLSLKTALLTLAQSHKIDIQLASDIDRQIVFSAHKKPLIDIIRDICDLANLRFSIKGQAIRIEADTPFPHNYNVQHLNLIRSTDNHTSIATDVFSNSTDLNATVDNGSNSNLSAKVENDFWAELKNNLEVIIGDSSLFTIHRQGGLLPSEGRQNNIEPSLSTLII
jgi:general secretion pathway protein D